MGNNRLLACMPAVSILSMIFSVLMLEVFTVISDVTRLRLTLYTAGLNASYYEEQCKLCRYSYLALVCYCYDCVNCV